MNVAQPLVQASLLGEAIDAGPALVLVADEDMRFVAVNETACESLGYDRKELLAMRVTDVAGSPNAPERYAQLVSEGEAAGKGAVVRKDGTRIPVVYRASRVTVAQMTFYVSVALPAD